MSGKNINFDDKKLKKSTFYKNKAINTIENIDDNNILVSKKEPYGNKKSVKYLIMIILDTMIMILLDPYV